MKERGGAPRVIFTADDFGLTRSINDAIEAAHRFGVLTTTSLMVGAAAADDAVERARSVPSLHVGLHVALVHDTPVSPPDRIPDLVDANGRLHDDLAASGVRWFFRPAVRAQLEAEIRAQFAAFAATGLRLDHVNAHAHMHVHPTVFGIVLRVAAEYGRPPLRIPYEPLVPSWRAVRRDGRRRVANAALFGPWTSLMRARAQAAGFRCNDYVFGLNDTGRMDRDALRALLRTLPPGTSECYFHVDAGNDEYAALVDPEVRALVDEGAVTSVTFADVGGAA